MAKVVKQADAEYYMAQKISEANKVETMYMYVYMNIDCFSLIMSLTSPSSFSAAQAHTRVHGASSLPSSSYQY